MNHPQLTGCLLGGAAGDSLGLPFEGLAAARIARLSRGPLRQRFLFGRGMLSDDTEHAAATILALESAAANPDLFSRDLARRLRWWLAAIPAGVGLATARSILKLWAGVSPDRSGVWSAGNGPLMRASVIGVWYQDSPDSRARFCEASTRITHSDPRAAGAARIVAEAAAHACHETGSLREKLDALATSSEMRSRLGMLWLALERGEPVHVFADSIGRRPGYVSGFAPDTAAVAIYSWLRHRGSFRDTLEAVIRAGGDTDTTAFVAGSLAGIDAGKPGIPAEWLHNIRDWPLSVSRLESIAAGQRATYPVWPLSIVRNLFFLAAVLVHAFRRALPPW